MENKLIIIILLCIGALFTAAPVLAYNEPPDPELEPLMIGRIEGTDTHFEIKDSEYLNVSLQSTEEITIVLESMPRMISMDVSSSTDSTSTNLTISELKPNTTYYKYQDSYKNKAVFIPNKNGKYIWTQNLTQPHHIWIQPENGEDARIQSKDTQTTLESDGVVFLPEECSDYGIWDATTSTCVLNRDLAESVEITTNNITLDCADHKVTGAGTGFGVYVNRKTHFAVKNCTINNFSAGAYLYHGSGHSFSNNNVSNNRYRGIFLTNSNNASLTDNIVNSNSCGISLNDSDDSSVVNNTASNNYHGIHLVLCENSVLGNNTINSNKGYGIYFNHAQSNTISENTISNNHCGFFLSSSNNNTITNNAFTNDGIFTSYSFNNTLTDNTVNNKPLIYLEDVSDHTISNTNAGQVILVNCDNIIVENLNLFNTFIGIQLFNTHNSKIIANNISENRVGINLYSSDSNKLFDNTILDNRTGIYISTSDNNQTYHNNFLNNTAQQARALYGSGNLFDNDYPDSFDLSTHGGNFWSDYTGVDEKFGPNQDEPGSDNIGDSPYSLEDGENNTDRYPFMEQSGWKTPQAPTYNVAVILAEPSDVPHEASSITEQPCKLIPEKIYTNGHNKEYFEDLTYCVTDYHRENSFGTVNLDFEIFDNDGDWFELTKNEQSYLNNEKEFVIDAINLTTNAGIDLSDKNMVIVLHSGEAVKREEDLDKKLSTQTWSPNSQPFGCPPYKIIVAEDDLTGAWAHEIGHIIGALLTPENTMIPDLSHRDILMGNVEKWDLMARGSRNEDGNNPPYMSSYTKEFLKWLNYDIHPKSAYGEYWINSLETSELEDNIFRYNLSDDTNDESPEYYILETRNRNLKTWDSSLPGLTSKHLVLYQVDTKRLKKYGYVPKGVTGYQEGMMWNQYRTVTIPGNNPEKYEEIFEINDGILNPLINETYRDLDNLVKFTAITDRTINDKYEIQAEIEELTNNSFIDDFWGVILKPSSNFEQKIKTTPAIFAPLENPLMRPHITMSDRAIMICKFCYWILLFPLMPLGLILLFLDKIIIPIFKFKKGKRAIKILLKIVWVIILITLITFIFCLILAPILEKREKPLPPCQPGSLCSNPLSYSISPDLDLHLYCDDRRHIGMNYETGEYEIEIEEAIVSGDNQGSPEWIFISPDIENCHFIVSSYDNQKFLDENPEIAQEMEDTTDSYEIYARYIDPETAIYTSNIISEELIEPGQELEQLITGTTDIAVLPAIPWQNPRYFKEQSISLLQESKTNNKAIDREIDSIIRHLNKSLNKSLWVDDFRLDSRHGRKALSEQSFAVRRLYHRGSMFNRKISMLERIIEIKQKFELDADKEEAEIKAINTILPVFNQVIDNLIKADRIIVETAIYDARNTPVENPRFQNTVNYFIEKAERELSRADKEISKNRPDKAIMRLTQSWSYSQLAIKFAAPLFHKSHTIGLHTIGLHTQFLAALNSFFHPSW